MTALPPSEESRAYATVSREVGMIVCRQHPAPLERTVYRICRAALLLLSDRQKSAEIAFSLADELSVLKVKPWP